jgi:hypothetical protein
MRTVANALAVFALGLGCSSQSMPTPGTSGALCGTGPYAVPCNPGLSCNHGFCNPLIGDGGGCINAVGTCAPGLACVPVDDSGIPAECKPAM